MGSEAKTSALEDQNPNRSGPAPPAATEGVKVEPHVIGDARIDRLSRPCAAI